MLYATLLSVPAVFILVPLSSIALVAFTIGVVIDVPTVIALLNDGAPLFSVSTVFAPPCAVVRRLFVPLP